MEDVFLWRVVNITNFVQNKCAIETELREIALFGLCHLVGHCYPIGKRNMDHSRVFF